MVDRYSDEEEDNQVSEKVGYSFNTDDYMSSSVPTSVEFDNNKNSRDVQAELELARKEILELKKQLSSLTAERRASADSGLWSIGGMEPSRVLVPYRVVLQQSI